MKINQAIHACALQIESLGVLILGMSGSGKSDLVLELIDNGYNFIADDLVLIEKINNQIYITNPNQQYQLYIRDIGIINVNNLNKKIIHRAPLHIVIQLITTQQNQYNNLELGPQTYKIDNKEFPLYKIHDVYNRNLALLIKNIIHIEINKNYAYEVI